MDTYNSGQHTLQGCIGTCTLPSNLSREKEVEIDTFGRLFFGNYSDLGLIFFRPRGASS